MKRVAKIAGAGPLADFSVGQRVMTREGYAGTIDDIAEGPGDLTTYFVTLDGGLGGGEYAEAEIQPLGASTTAAQQQAAIVEAGVEHTAADDYPELGTILTDRLPPQLTSRVASKTASDQWGSHEEDYDSGLSVEPDSDQKCKECPSCGAHNPEWMPECYACSRCFICGEVLPRGGTPQETYVLREPHRRTHLHQASKTASVTCSCGASAEPYEGQYLCASGHIFSPEDGSQQDGHTVCARCGSDDIDFDHETCRQCGSSNFKTAGAAWTHADDEDYDDDLNWSPDPGTPLPGHCTLCGKKIVLRRGSVTHADGSNDHAVVPSEGAPLGTTSSQVAEHLALYLPPVPPGEQRASTTDLTGKQKAGYQEGFSHGQEGITRNPSDPDDPDYRVGYDIGWAEGVTVHREPPNTWDIDDLGKDQTADIPRDALPADHAPIAYASLHEASTGYFHSSQHQFSPGDIIFPARAHGSSTWTYEGTQQPEGEEWRSEFVWLSKDPGNAGAWWGHDYPGVHVYEVEPIGGADQHTPTDWDMDVAADHAADQWYCARAKVIREVPLSEWNDFHKSSSLHEAGGVADWLHEHGQPGSVYSYDWCFLPDAPVLMADGTERPISEIEVGDRVITHTGRIQPVTWVGSRHYEGDLAYVSVHGDTTREFVSTDNHRVWAANRDYGLDGNRKACSYRGVKHADLAPEFGWREAGSLGQGDYLSRSVLTEETPLRVTYFHHRTSMPMDLKVAGEVAWLLGLYMGDGFLQQAGHAVSFSLHEDQQRIVNRVRRVAEEFFPGSTVKVYPEKGKRAVRVDVRHWALVRLVTEMVGVGSEHKRLDGRLLTLPLDAQQDLLSGYIDSDGCEARDGRVSADSISVMPRQVREIATRLGHHVNMNPKWSSDRYPNAKDQIRVLWFGGKNRLTKQFRRDGSVWQQINGVRRTHYSGPVWDIEVAEDHSFRAYGFNVHNCRFRRDSQCWLPKGLDEEASRFAGYAVWIPENRGHCYRVTWDSQKQCPTGMPGPHSGPDGYTDATISWEQGGQREGHPGEEVADPHKFEKYFTSSLTHVAAFEMTATWTDVRNKAKRIRTEGGVRMVAIKDNVMVAHVKGDHGIYETEIVRFPGKTSTASWACGCKWGSYSWGRSGPWKKYEGRMCAHALALQYEAQSRGMNGRTLTLDEKQPAWMDQKHVHRPGDYDRTKQRYSSRPAEEQDESVPSTALAAQAMAEGQKYQQVREMLLSLGVESPAKVVASLRTKAFKARVDGEFRDIDIDGDGFVDETGEPVDPAKILYPKWDPTFGLNPNDQKILTTGASGLTKVVVKARDVQVGDRLDMAGKTRISIVHEQNGQRLVQTQTRGTRSPSVQRWGMDEDVTVYRTASHQAAVSHEQFDDVLNDLRISPSDLWDQWEEGISAEDFTDDLGSLYEWLEAMDDAGWTTRKASRTATENGPQNLEAAAKAMLEMARRNEPDTTLMLSALALEHGGDMVGLDNRLKTEQSLLRKIKERLDEHDGNASKTAYSISDSLRYTMLFPTSTYTQSTRAVLDDLKSAGYNERVKNYWEDHDTYDGINVAMMTPKGHPFELQFHTPESLETKDISHRLYEDWRVNPDPEVRKKLADEMIALWDNVPNPAGALSIPDLKRMPLASLDDWGLGRVASEGWTINGKPYEDGKWIEVEPGTWYRGADVAKGEVPSRLVVKQQGDKWAWEAQVLTFIGAPHEDTGYQKPGAPSGTAKTLEEAQARAEKSLTKDHEFYQRYDDRMRSKMSVRKTASTTHYHLTSKLDFHLDPHKKPRLNTTMGGDLAPGIFLTDQPEHWANGYGYWQPWLVEFEVPPNLKDLPGVIQGGYGSEIYIPAILYDRLRIVRVMALDGWCREEYNDWGWTEEQFGTTYDTEEPLPPTRPSGYRAPDARQMGSEFAQRYPARMAKFRRIRGKGVYASLEVTSAKSDGPEVSGVVVKAADTGRVLMLQRSMDDDKASGKWEWPGGHHEEGDLTSLHAGIREWQEEVGQPFPEGGYVAHTWTSPNGVYQGHLVVIPTEADLVLNEGRIMENPDDPDSKACEQVAWWDPEDAQKNPALREECKKTPWNDLKTARKEGSKMDIPDEFGSLFDDAAQGITVSASQQRQVLAEWGLEPSYDFESLQPFAGPNDPVATQGTMTPGFEEPEPALPVTYGEEDEEQKVASLLRQALPHQGKVMNLNPGPVQPYNGPSAPQETDEERGRRLLAYVDASLAGEPVEGPNPFAHIAAGQADNEIASAAANYLATGAHPTALAREALKSYSPIERQAIIDEGMDVQASNLDRLDIRGTHYEALEATARSVPEDEDLTFLDGDPNLGDF